MFLKNESCLFKFIFVLLLMYSIKASSNPDTDYKTRILEHLASLKYFSASFIQIDGEELSEGKFYIGKNRVRAEYFSPAKILIILDEDKAMYYNYDLDEDEFFNPKDTNAWFFYDIFKNPIFFRDGILETNNNELILKKEGFDNEKKNFLIKIHFENNPLILRKVEVFIDQEYLLLSVFNHKHNQSFDKKFFKLINPSFLN